MKSTNFRFSSLLFCFFIIFIAAIVGDTNAEADECVYTLYVKTGSLPKSGTHSRISVILGDADGKSVSTGNLENWGLMPPSHNYFEKGNLDIFSVRLPCITTPLCSITVTSDGSGPYHGWYCEYVEVTTSGPHVPCTQTLFKIDQWLATDSPPYKLTASVDGCGVLGENGVDVEMRGNKKGAFVVHGNGVGAAQK